MPLNLLELFAGSRSVGKESESLGMNVFSVDWTPYEGINLSKDIGELTMEDVPFVPDIVWASPDCTTYSIAAISKHRNGTEPKSDYAKKCDQVNQHFISMIQEWLLINPNLKFYIENPRGMLRKMPFMQDFIRRTVWYCQYGDDRAKPTDIFTNDFEWIPKPVCKNGNKNCHYQPAPRGSKTGTQGRKDSHNRSKIPAELCKELLTNIKTKKTMEQTEKKSPEEMQETINKAKNKGFIAIENDPEYPLEANYTAAIEFEKLTPTQQNELVTMSSFLK